ncbi:MAG: flagellar hook-associated protein FlgL [Candidatus Acidiferrales bacterium]
MSARVDPNILPDLLSGLNEMRQQLNAADAELASGRSINEPSDNPAGTAALVLNHAQQSQTDTFQQNITDLQSKMQIADSALSSAETAIQQAISVGVEAGNSTLSDQDRQAIAQQLSGIQQQLVGIANSTAGGTYLFGGTLVTTQPFTPNAADPSGVTYSGNSSVLSVEIANGQSVTTSVPGNQLFLNPAGSVLGAINQLIAAVQSNSGIAAANTALGQAASEFSTERLVYGTSLNQLQSTETFLANDRVQLQTQESNIAGADLAQVTTNFSQADVAYQSLLQAEGKILSLPTLLDYLQ